MNKKSVDSVWLEVTEVSVVMPEKGKPSCTIEGKGSRLFGPGGINHIAQSIHTETGGGCLLAVGPSKSWTHSPSDPKAEMHWEVTPILEDYDEIIKRLKKVGFTFA